MNTQGHDAPAAGRPYKNPLRSMLRKLRRPWLLELDDNARALRAALGTGSTRDAVLLLIERGLRDLDEQSQAIIRRCDIAGERTAAVAADLYISNRQFFRCRAGALDAIQAELDRLLAAGGLARTELEPARYAVGLGRLLLSRGELRDHVKSLDSFRATIIAYPRSVEASVGLCLAYTAIAAESGSEARAHLRSAAQALTIAREFAPHAPEVLACDAYLALWQARDADLAARFASEAIVADHRCAEGHAAAGTAALSQGRFDGAAAAFERAVDLAPADLRLRAGQIGVSYYRGHYEKTARTCEDLLDHDAHCSYALGYLCAAYNAMDRADVVVSRARSHVNSGNPNVFVLAHYAAGLARRHDEVAARAILVHGGLPSALKAVVSAALGDDRDVEEHVLAALEEDNRFAALIGFDPAFKSPVYEPMMQRVLQPSRSIGARAFVPRAARPVRAVSPMQQPYALSYEDTAARLPAAYRSNRQ
jgi:tetratricopeptide (TPR) repeat protein